MIFLLDVHEKRRKIKDETYKHRYSTLLDTVWFNLCVPVTMGILLTRQVSNPSLRQAGVLRVDTLKGLKLKSSRWGGQNSRSSVGGARHFSFPWMLTPGPSDTAWSSLPASVLAFLNSLHTVSRKSLRLLDGKAAVSAFTDVRNATILGSLWSGGGR